jgi:hypothetical protein
VNQHSFFSSKQFFPFFLFQYKKKLLKKEEKKNTFAQKRMQIFFLFLLKIDSFFLYFLRDYDKAEHPEHEKPYLI